MILREWRAEIRRQDRDAYVAYVRDTGLAGYASTPGNLGSAIAVRDLDAVRSEIVTYSYWTSLEAIAAFAGEPIDRARYFPMDEQYLLTRPEKVTHYDLLTDELPHAVAQGG